MAKEFEVPETVEDAGQRIAPEILAVIAAAATVALGAHVRIGSVEPVHGQAGQVSRWTKQGRASVQASHNLRTKSKG